MSKLDELMGIGNREDADQDFDPDFDTETEDTTDTREAPAPTSSPPHPDPADLAQLIEDAVTPLMESIDTIAELITEDPHGLTLLSTQLAEIGASLHTAITNISTAPAPPPDDHKNTDDDPNIDALKFQVAMCQPCNGSILPAAVSHELDRLYAIEDAMRTAAPAEAALTHLIDHTPVLVSLPTDEEDRLLTLAMLNAWYTRARPDNEPLEA